MIIRICTVLSVAVSTNLRNRYSTTLEGTFYIMTLKDTGKPMAQHSKNIEKQSKRHR